jgi:predicted nucleic acid-binding Zn ribbon protein
VTDRPVRRLGDSLHDVARSLGMPEPDALSRIIAVWDDVVGDAVARHTQPQRLKDRVLTVEADGGEWVTQLRYLESAMVTAITERVGAGVVERVVFVVARPG